MSPFLNFFKVSLKSIVRDRILLVIFAAALVMFLLVPAFSLFSMRQVQELSITLSLSAISFFLLLVVTVSGSSAIWRDVERRYTASLLGLPLSRTVYVLGKFFGIALVVFLCCLVLGLVSSAVIGLASAQYRSDIPIHWLNIFVAICADGLKYVLLAAVAILFSSFSTSFYLPFFATIAIYISGSATQDVYEYLSTDLGQKMSPCAKFIVKGLYYLLPNFSAFNLKVQAVYGHPLSFGGILVTFSYFLVYTAILLSVAVWIFKRRELP